MGFRTGSYAKVWEVKPKSDKVTEGRISITKKNRDTGEYEQDFGGFVRFVGAKCAADAAALHEGASIKLGEVDVTRRYDKEAKKEYVNYTVFAFEQDTGGRTANTPQAGQTQERPAAATRREPDDGESDELPF